MALNRYNNKLLKVTNGGLKNQFSEAFFRKSKSSGTRNG